MAFLRCPAQFYGFRSEISNDPNIYPHTYIRSMMFSRTFWGLYWSVVNSHIIVGTCRRLGLFIPCLLPVSVHVPLATTVKKIANISRYSHIESWNAWHGRTTVRLRWTASTCKYCISVSHTILVWSLPIHLHQALTQSRSPSPGLRATIRHKYDIPTLHTLAILRYIVIFEALTFASFQQPHMRGVQHQRRKRAVPGTWYLVPGA